MQVDTAVTLRASLRHLGPSHILPPRPSLPFTPQPSFRPCCCSLRLSLLASPLSADCQRRQGFSATCGPLWAFTPRPLSLVRSLSLSLSLSLCRPHPSSLFSFLPSSVRVLLLPSPSFTHLHPSSASIPYRSLFPFSASQRRCGSHVAAAGRTLCAGAGGRRSCVFPAFGRCVFGTFGIRTSGASLCQAPAAAPRAATVGRSYNTP